MEEKAAPQDTPAPMDASSGSSASPFLFDAPRATLRQLKTDAKAGLGAVGARSLAPLGPPPTEAQLLLQLVALASASARTCSER